MSGFRWIGSRARLRYMPANGLWLVHDKTPDGWLEIHPLDDSAQNLANMSPTGTLWVRPRDMTRVLTQDEELF